MRHCAILMGYAPGLRAPVVLDGLRARATRPRCVGWATRPYSVLMGYAPLFYLDGLRAPILF